MWDVVVSGDTARIDPSVPARMEDAARAVLAAESAAEAELSIALVDDETITRMNREYLDHEGPTDVISFPLRTPDSRLVGDVYIGLDQVRRQAVEEGVPLEEELIRLTIHGTLHVLGWDHPEENRVDSPMYLRQEELLARFLRGSP